MGVDAVTFAMITVLAGGGTFGIRALFIMLVRSQQINPKLLAALSFVPAAVFSGLVTHSLHLELLLKPGDPALINLVALSIAAFVSVKTKSIHWTLLTGMVTMWGLNWVVGLAQG